MKLLLDEMWTPDIAAQLRRRGYDVIAVAERPELRGRPDTAIFSAAASEGRTILTENVGDYRALTSAAIQRGEQHAGLILTTDRRYPRRDPRTTGRLVHALEELLASELDLTNQEHWLA